MSSCCRHYARWSIKCVLSASGGFSGEYTTRVVRTQPVEVIKVALTASRTVVLAGVPVWRARRSSRHASLPQCECIHERCLTSNDRLSVRQCEV